MNKFFTFIQNNSGGSFVTDRSSGIAHYVIVEAETFAKANELAERIGLYFDGEGDCPCCGNRWSEQWDDRYGEESPKIYGKHPSEEKDIFSKPGERCCIHYLDGRKEWF